ncbi:MAG: type VII secretion protein EssC [Oscillospiraceae bacterium]|nr:type VII secretion protein EssC [Oscillospiraceae bacterium]
MNFVLTIHYKLGVQEIFLPSIQNRTVTLELDNKLAGINKELTLLLDVFDGVWIIHPNDSVTFDKSQTLSDGLRINAKVVKNNDEIIIFADELKVNQTLFKKYHVEPGSKIKLGSNESNNIVYSTKNLVSGNHFVIEESSRGAEIVDKSRNGTFVNGKKVNGRQKINYGDEINVFGLKIVWLKAFIAISQGQSDCKISGLKPVDAEDFPVVENEPADADEFYSRSPRQIPKLDDEPVEFDSPPDSGIRRQRPLWMAIGPAMTMVLPMTIGIMFMMLAARAADVARSPFMFMGIFTSATAACIGVFWALTNARYQKRAEKEDEEKRQSKYRGYLDRMESIVDEKHDYNRMILSESYPSINQSMELVSRLDSHLWERNVNHPDFLTIRIGMGAIPSPNKIGVPKERFSLVDDDLAERPFMIQKKYRLLKNVPILLSLLEHKLIGVIADNRRTVLETANLIAAEIAVLHSYTDVKMVFIIPQTEDWSFAKWLPHTWAEDNSIRLIANKPSSIGEVLYHLSGVVRTRSDDDRQKSNNLPHYVVFIGDPDLVEHEAAMKSIMDKGQEIGFSTILLYNEIDRLPSNCTVIVQRTQEYSGYYSFDNKFEDVSKVNFDSVKPEQLNNTTRFLSGVKVKEAEGSGAIPQMLTFLDMYKTSKADGIDIYRNWLENRTYESMKAMIGARGGGTPVYLDIHEKYHGPHGLVAGTTGSGKSEMLQTYILSLAVSYHPHEVSFILIDYKGGGMAESFKALTHVAGIITNLGGNQTNRALASIRSEIKRRQAVFNEYKIKHIDDYIELYRAGKAGDPMPHLLIIADEFAELKKEQPEFVRELVSASRVGRSLGVHLILATQKPDGVVDDQIWSNTKFRVCLRVAEKADSMGMLKHPEAAYITQAGRGFFQVGNDEIFEEFQSGWSGARYEPDIPFSDEKSSDVKLINLWGRARVLSTGKKKETASEEKQIQLDIVTAYIAEIAKKHGIEAISNVWLPPLPKKLYLSDLQETELPDNELCVPVGLLDDPVLQEQRTVSVNFTQDNHMIVASSAAGGKTTFMQTVLYGLITSKTPEQLHIYIIDYASRALSVFGVLPHVGGVLFDDNPDKIDKLISMLMKELNRRKIQIASKSLGSFKEYSKLYDDVPAIMLVVDNFSAYMEGNPRQEDNMMKLAAESASYGIYLMISCTNHTDVRSKLRQNIRNGIGLQMPGKYDYDEILGNRGSMTAEEGCPGRGLIKMDSPDQKESRSLEFQTALCIKTDDTSLINAKLAEVFKEMADVWKGRKATRIPEVPSDLSYEAFKDYPETKEAIQEGLFPIAYDISEAQLVSLNLEDIFCYIISGGMRTGKSNAVRFFASAAKQTDTDVIIIDTSEQLKDFASDNEILCLVTADEIYNWVEQTLEPEFKRRNGNIKKAGGRKFTKKAQENEKQLLVLIHDFSGFIAAAKTEEKDMTDFLAAMTKMGSGHKVTIAAVITREDSTTYAHDPIYTGFISWKTGLHLGGQVDTQRALEFDMNYAASSKKLPPGYFHTMIGPNTIVAVMPEV